MRVFPSGLRVRSDNLDPSVFWRKGVQMVALNWQRWDEGMMLNQGMFTGSEGWMLKPKGYLGHHGSGNASRMEDIKKGAGKAEGESQASAIVHKTLTLTITVLAMQDIPLPLGDTNSAALHPYVKIELHVEKPAERSSAPIEGGGKSKDEDQYKQRTRPGKGTDVDYGGEVVRFRDVPGVVEELSFVRYARKKLFPCLQFRGQPMALSTSPLHLLFTVRAYTLRALQNVVHAIVLVGNFMWKTRCEREVGLAKWPIFGKQPRGKSDIKKKLSKGDYGLRA